MNDEMIPVTIGYDRDRLPIGKLFLDDEVRARFDPDFHRFEVGYVRKDDGTVDLVELSICSLSPVEQRERASHGEVGVVVLNQKEDS